MNTRGFGHTWWLSVAAVAVIWIGCGKASNDAPKQSPTATTAAPTTNAGAPEGAAPKGDQSEAASTAALWGPGRTLSDPHVHVVSPWAKAPTWSAGFEQLQVEMNRTKTTRATIMGYPLDLDQWMGPRGCTYTSKYDDVVWEWAQKDPRLVPFLNGFDPREASSVAYVRQRLKQGFRGIGELPFKAGPDLKCYARDFYNTPVMHQIYELAGAVGAIVGLHPPATAAERMALFTKHPATRFLVFHTDELDDVEALLALPNLAFEFNSVDSPLGPDAFVALMAKHPDRFVLGTERAGRFGYAFIGTKVHRDVGARYETTDDFIAYFRPIFDRIAASAGEPAVAAIMGGNWDKWLDIPLDLTKLD